MITAIHTNKYQYFKGAAAETAAPEKTNIQMPTKDRNYCVFDQKKVDYYVAQREQALPYIKKVLQNSQDEKQIVEALYITDRLLDAGVKGIPRMYPLFAKFNDTKSQNIQAYLAGIYRKTQIPDAFGPLVKMLIQNSLKQETTTANEEIGGAVLEYIHQYSTNPPKIDYSA